MSEGKRILVADDDATIRIMVQQTLEAVGFEVSVARDGHEALALFRNERPDMLISDLMMPGLDGFELTRRIKAERRGRHIPIVMMTGLDDLEAVNRAYELGVTDFITKPITWAAFPYRVRHLMHTWLTERQMARLGRLLDQSSNEAYLFAGPELRFSYCNESVTRALGYAPEQMLQMTLADLQENLTLDSLRSLLAPLAEGQVREVCYEGIQRRRGGDSYPVETRINLISDELDPQYFAIVLDISERKRNEEQIHYLAYHNLLTGLPNRRLFNELFVNSLSLARRFHEMLALLLVDIDRFKYVNDSFGHEFGDRVLKHVAVTLASRLRDSDIMVYGEEPTVSRMGGDEFVIVLHRLNSVEDAHLVASRVHAELAKPFVIDELELALTCSIGIAVCPDDGGDKETLLRKVEDAVQDAKRRGRNCIRFYTEALNRAADQKQRLYYELRTGIERSELELHYQPQVSLSDGYLFGVEALVRWRRRSGELLMPDRFVSLAEETGLMVAVGDWVLREACQQAVRWQEAGFLQLRVAVNLSVPQLHAADFGRRTLAELARCGLSSSCLELEITESMLLEDSETILENLWELRRAGVRIALDDFGTGYSSLGYLNRLPIDVIKIDKSFIDRMLDDGEGDLLVATIANLGRNLGKELVAEGVETAAQYQRLRDIKVDLAQGYLISRPLPAAELQALLDRMQQERRLGMPGSGQAGQPGSPPRADGRPGQGGGR